MSRLPLNFGFFECTTEESGASAQNSLPSESTAPHRSHNSGPNSSSPGSSSLITQAFSPYSSPNPGTAHP